MTERSSQRRLDWVREMIAPTHGVGAVPAADEIGVERSESFGRLLLRAFAEHRLALVGVGIIVFMILFSFVGPLFYVTDQVHTNPLAVTQAPSAHHLLGTDDVGYDVLGRLMLAGQSSLEVAVARRSWRAPWAPRGARSRGTSEARWTRR